MSVPDVTTHHLDLHDIAAVDALIDRVKPSHLLLSAWSTAHGAFWTDPANELWVASCVATAGHFLECGGRRIVLAGSCAEYDWSDRVLIEGPIPESAAQGDPQTPYGRAKRKAADAMSGLAREAGASFAVGRIFFPMGWGEGPQRFLPTVVTAMLEGRPARLGSGQQVRDVMDVRDTGVALAALVASDVSGAVNIGSGRGVKLADVARRAASMCGGPDLLQLGALPARAGEPQQLVADIRRLRDEVGFSPCFTLDDTIASSFEYWSRKGPEMARQAAGANSYTGTV